MDLTIKHKPGKKNVNADALSRCPTDESSVAVVDTSTSSEFSPTVLDMEAVREFQLKDDEAVLILSYLQEGTLPEDEKLARKLVLESKHFCVIEGVLYHDDQTRSGRTCVVVPKELRLALLEEAHSGRFAGHLAEKKVYDRLKRYVWWRGMRNDVHKFCRACLVCSSRKGTRKTFQPPLQPIPVAGSFHRVAVDILQLPLTANGNCYVAVFMDYFMKWPEAFAIPDQKAEMVAKLFIDNIICRHEVPEELLSDRGANFLSTLIQEICQVLSVRKINTSGYHPQTDWLVEKFNSILISMIAKSCDVHQRDWNEHLPSLLFAYRTCAQESTKESPFYLLHRPSNPHRDSSKPCEISLCY